MPHVTFLGMKFESIFYDFHHTGFRTYALELTGICSFVLGWLCLQMDPSSSTPYERTTKEYTDVTASANQDLPRHSPRNLSLPVSIEIHVSFTIKDEQTWTIPDFRCIIGHSGILNHGIASKKLMEVFPNQVFQTYVEGSHLIVWK